MELVHGHVVVAGEVKSELLTNAPLPNLMKPPCAPFDQLLATTPLPAPGPAHFAARRALWLAPNGQRREPEPSRFLERLETVLAPNDAVENDRLWRTDVEKIWRGLNSGGRLKHRMRLGLAVGTRCSYRRPLLDIRQIKVIHASWIRDSTWPRGCIVPPSTDEDEDEDDSLLNDIEASLA
jgi:hypothetical protein